MKNEYQFDINQFNKEFEKIQEERKNIIEQEKEKKLAELNKEQEKINYPYSQSIGEIIIGIKDTFFGILKDMFNNELNNIFIKNHRLFYIGFSLFIILFIFVIIFIFKNIYG